MPATIRRLAYLLWALLVGAMFCVTQAQAGTPVTLYQSYAGNLNYVVTGGTLRTQPNSGNACAVTNSNTAALNGIPAGATIRAAYLYWAGSGVTADNNVTLDASNISASRSFTETFVFGSTYDFFSGFANVTAQVAAKGNGNYTFSNLTVNNGAPHCAVQAVLSGWSMLVIYEHAGEPLRVVNVFDGFQYFRGSSLALTPNNFVIPAVGIDGKHGVLTWEGDVENSGTLGGFSEDLVFNGSPLINALNPAANQFNSTISVNGVGSTTSYGVDLDVYDVSALLSAGDTSATSIYSSGSDLVLLSMEVISVTNTPVADLAISKSHSGNFTVGQNGSYSITVTNNGPSDETGTITVTDTLPAGLAYVSGTGSGWTCGAIGQDVTCTHAGPLASGNSLPVMTLTVSVASAAAPSVTNTATVSGTLFDNDASNNSSADLTTVIAPDLSTSTKTVADLNGGDADPNDVLRYTITLTESSGMIAGNVSVVDNLPANTINLSVVSFPAGATDSSTAAQVNIFNITVPASGSVSIVFDVTVDPAASVGTLIDNSATINNPNGPGATPAAPTVIVSESQIAGSGTKPLYLGAPGAGSPNNPVLPQPMSRTPLSATPAPDNIRIRRQDTPVIWAQTPATQATLNLNAATVPVILQLRRNNQTQNRTIRVTLDYVGAATGVLGFVDVTVPGSGPGGLSNTVTQPFTFPVAIPAVSLPAGTQLRVTVDNSPTGGNGRAIYVYPYDAATGDTSRVEFDAATVINVDSVGFYDAAYPGGALQTTTAPGTTVYIRAVVSDPFGSFDITSANIDIINPLGSPVVSAAAMTEVADSGVATKTYEYAYTLPVIGASGAWTARVTANEGTEGTISDLGVGTITVTSPSLSVLKSASTATANPGTVITYTIQVFNTGDGNAINVVVDDDVSPFTAFSLDAYGPGVAFQFVEGAPASGLTLGVPVYSNDNGATYTYIPVSGGGGAPAGFDNNVTNWQVLMSGSMNAGGSFSLNYQMQVK